MEDPYFPECLIGLWEGWGVVKKTDSNMFFPPGVQAELMRRALEEIVGRL